MSNYNATLFVSISFALTVIACNKNTTGTTASSGPSLVLAKNSVKIGEPLLITTKGQTAGSTIHWSATPNASIWTSASGDSATFLFTSPGVYQVGASYGSGTSAPYDSTHSSLTVSDSVYMGDSSFVICASIIEKPIATGDQLTLAPIAFSDSAGLVFLATTRTVYDFGPALGVTGNFSGQGGGFEVDFNTVTESPCMGYDLQGPAMRNLFFTLPPNGTYPLVCKLNGTTYEGSMTVTDSGCSFAWNYTSGVIISPLQIRKQ